MPRHNGESTHFPHERLCNVRMVSSSGRLRRSSTSAKVMSGESLKSRRQAA